MGKTRKFNYAWRFVSLLLVLCMTLGLAATTVFAEGDDSVTITTVDVGNVFKIFDSTQPVAFTAEVNPNSECANQMQIVDEIWKETGSSSNILKKTDAPACLTAGVTYHYGVTLQVKERYVFPADSSSINLICDGKVCTFLSYDRNADGTEVTIYFNEVTVNVNDGSSNTAIGDVDIEGVTFNYKPGDAPKATAYKCDPYEDFYEIKYEYWEQMEQTSNGLEPVAYWYSDKNKNDSLREDQKITAFQEGKSYMYSIFLKAKDGYAFSPKSSLLVNANKVDAKNITNTGTSLFVTAVKTIKPQDLKEIEVVEINNATLNFKDGDAPVFTGTISDTRYRFVFEAWKTDGEGISSSEWFNNDDHLQVWGGKIITTFDKDKTYTYMIYFTTSAEGSLDGWVFSENTKLKINGQEVAFNRDSSDNEQQFSGMVDLTMTPTAAESTSSYKVIEGTNSSWTQNSDGTLTFRADGDFSKFTGIKIDSTLIDASNYTAVSGSTIVTLKADYLEKLSEGNHEITFVYVDGECSTTFEVKKTSEDSAKVDEDTGLTQGTNENKEFTQDTNETSSATYPETGDSSNIVPLIVLIITSCIGFVVTKEYNKKAKYGE